MIAQTTFNLPELAEDLDLVSAPPPGAIHWLWIVAVAIALLAIVIPLYLALRPRRAQGASSSIPKPDPAIAANRRLQALRAELSTMSQREAAIELASILRDYVCDRFDVRAPFQTTREFVDRIGVAPHFPPNQIEPIVDLLNTCDLVKFATGILHDGAFEQWLEYVSAFVRSTPLPQPDEAVATGRSANG